MERSSPLESPAPIPYAWSEMIDWAAITAAIGSIATVAGSFGGYLLAGHNEEKRDERVTAREAETQQ